MARAYFQVYFSHAGRNGTHGKGFRTKKEREAGLNIGGALLGTTPGGMPCGKIACQTPTPDPPKRKIPEMG